MPLFPRETISNTSTGAAFMGIRGWEARGMAICVVLTNGRGFGSIETDPANLQEKPRFNRSRF
jgi:hypothetical protein